MEFSRVNIIFVRDTVQTCLPFLRSLIDVTSLPLRLVANGCEPYEEQLLALACEESERIEFHSLRSARTIEHGEALDQLLAIETSELFTFMDSDIFATAPVSMSDIEPLPGEVASSACLPVWHSEHDARMPVSFQIMGGRYTSSATGHFLGCTYLASYRSEALREVAASMSLSFRRYKSKDLPREILRKLDGMGLRKQFYDTAKVINIMLQHEGHKMSFRDVDGLVHVGGLSAKVADRLFDLTGLKRAIKFVLPLRLLNLINRRRYGCDQIEASDMADLYDRRTRARELIAELGDGQPYSAMTTALLGREAYVQDLARLFAAYSGDGKHSADSQDAGKPSVRQVAKNSGFPH